MTTMQLDAQAQKLISEWLRIGRENPWIRSAYDPPFSPESFRECNSLAELEERIGHGNWSLGTAFSYQDLCFVNQVDGGVRRLLAATKEQCQRLEY